MTEFSPALALDVKNLDETGYVQGIAAAYGNVDFGNDRIMPGAASKSLLGRSSMPMLLYHDQKRPIGKWAKIEETSGGVLVEGKISTKTRDGAEAYELVKDGALSGLSIGYKTRRARMNGKVRELHEIDVWETSFVTIGMNPATGVLSVKEIEDLRSRLATGDRLTEREWETLLKKSFDLSNAEAERAVRINLKGQGEPGDTAPSAVEFAERLRTALLG